MASPQTGIFALGNLAHSYLVDLVDGAESTALAAAVGDLSGPRTTMGGVNLVGGFRSGVWASIAPSRPPRELHDFDSPVVGADGYAMPATQHDLVLWIAGGSYDVVFDAALSLIAAVARRAQLADEIAGWSYHRDLDLTGSSTAPRTRRRRRHRIACWSRKDSEARAGRYYCCRSGFMTQPAGLHWVSRLRSK